MRRWDGGSRWLVGVKGGQGLNGLGVDPRALIQRLASPFIVGTAAAAVPHRPSRAA